MSALPLAILPIVFGLTPPHALTEADLVERYCVGMIQEFRNPDKTRTDCISDTHAIEVEFSHKWAEAIGQALHYALWTEQFADFPEAFSRWHHEVSTPKKPGISSPVVQTDS